MVNASTMEFKNFLIPLVLVFSVILVVLWILGRCRYKVFRKSKHLNGDIVVTLDSGLTVKFCDFILYCCWSANDRSADIIKFYDKINVISFQTAVTKTAMDECVICKEPFDTNKQICSFKCNHFFHVLCIVKWLAEQKKCPLCWMDIATIKETCGNHSNDRCTTTGGEGVQSQQPPDLIVVAS